MRTLVIGDIHGGLRALTQCLVRANYNICEDKIICLGDVADGWTEIKECFDLLITLKAHMIIGNHDDWLYDWFLTGNAPWIWTSQGGINSIKSYMPTVSYLHVEYLQPEHIPQRHIDYLTTASGYIEDELDNGKKRLYVHGGFDWEKPIDRQTKECLMWDGEGGSRALFRRAYQNEMIARKSNHEPKPFGDYEEIFIGHSTTSHITPERSGFADLDGRKPIKLCNVWCLDQGGGWEGYLTIMDVDTKEYWQSDKVSELYPNEKGRS